jgi:hypothetical protein
MHDMNLQVVSSPDGSILWVSGSQGDCKVGLIL